jgi:hypothetical protein
LPKSRRYFNKKAVTFKSKVKIMIDAAKEPVIISGLKRLFLPTEPVRITGSSVKLQGASTVKTPARKEMGKRAIFLL